VLPLSLANSAPGIKAGYKLKNLATPGNDLKKKRENIRFGNKNLGVY